MAKVEGRKVDILKPSIKFDILNNLLFKPEWDYEEINNIYNYEKAIKEKRVTIIDMEEEQYGERAVRAGSMLLLQLQSAMAKDRAKKADYSVYIDDAAAYMAYINNLLKYGDYFGFMTTLFLKSRQELGENVIALDNYVRNFILLQGINYEDAKYFSARMDIGGSMPQVGVQTLMDRDYGSITCEYLENKTFKRKIEEGILIDFPEEKKKEFMEKGLYWKKRNKEIKSGDHNYQLAKESKALSINEEKTTYLDDIKEKVEKTIDVVSEEKEDKKKEPQLNQKLKTTNFKKEEKETNFSLLDEFDLPGSVPEPEVKEEEPVMMEPEVEDIPVEENIEPTELEFDPSEDIDFEIPLETELEDFNLEENHEEEFDLSSEEENETFHFGNKNQPYRKIKNAKVVKTFSAFK